jgi:hypothetical protein
VEARRAETEELAMWVDPDVVIRAQWRDRVEEEERERRAARARAGQAGTGGSLSARWWRLRQAAGFGLVRTGLRLLDARRA